MVLDVKIIMRKLVAYYLLVLFRIEGFILNALDQLSENDHLN